MSAASVSTRYYATGRPEHRVPIRARSSTRWIPSWCRSTTRPSSSTASFDGGRRVPPAGRAARDAVRVARTAAVEGIAAWFPRPPPKSSPARLCWRSNRPSPGPGRRPRPDRLSRAAVCVHLRLRDRCRAAGGDGAPGPGCRARRGGRPGRRRQGGGHLVRRTRSWSRPARGRRRSSIRAVRGADPPAVGRRRGDRDGRAATAWPSRRRRSIAGSARARPLEPWKRRTPPTSAS